MLHRNSAGKLVEINKMHFKNDQLCFNKIYSLYCAQLSHTGAVHVIRSTKNSISPKA